MPAKPAVAALLAALSVLSVGCSVRDRSDAPAASAAPAAPAAVTFDIRDLGDGLTAPVPAGWTAPDPAFPRIFRPPADGELDWEVTLWWVDMECGDPCHERSSAGWEEAAEAGDFAQFEDEEAFAAIRRDETLPEGRLIEAENNFEVVVLTIARWVDGAPAYLACRASVPVEHAGLLAAFEQACLEVGMPEA